MHDETFNYSVIKLIVALNEQFMVASLPQTPQHHNNGLAAQQTQPVRPEGSNRVLRVLMTRGSSSPTFGENLIFMLNRADRTPEDLCMQLLVLKLLYLLFTTKGMAEYFYTNDLCVLVDVFLREIGDIDEDNESVRPSFTCPLDGLNVKIKLTLRFLTPRSFGIHTCASCTRSSPRRSCGACPTSDLRSCARSSPWWRTRISGTLTLPRSASSPAA